MISYRLCVPLLFLGVAIAGCSGSQVKGSLEPHDAAVSCSEDRSPFVQDGHLYTTLSILDLERFPIERQLAISYFSQYPDIDKDYEAVPVSFKYLLLPNKWKWRNDITGKLHSLHGGDRVAIDERRKSIRIQIVELIKDPSNDWAVGLFIHALGDSYAHTKNQYNSSEERAYGVWIGHALPTLAPWSDSPDKIKTPINEPKYLGYVSDLYETLRTPEADDVEFIKFLNFVDELACDGLCPDFHALYHEDLELQPTRIARYMKCMNSKMRQLSVYEVQSVMDRIVTKSTIDD